MGFRDRFFTPTTARAILSWRLLLGAGVAVAAGLLGGPWWLAVVLGVATYAGSVALAMPKAPRDPARSIDPFTVGEPWRQLVQQSQRSGRRLRDTVAGIADGPLKDNLQGIAEQLQKGLADAWEIAKRGDQIDAAVTRLDPVGLRSKLGTLEGRAGASPAPDEAAAIESVRRQLESADRLKAQSAETASKLQLSQTRLDELVARASEVAVGAAEPVSYAHDVDDLVVQLEALRQAIDESRPTESPET